MSGLPDGARAISARELRKCAESADGRRGRTLRFVYVVKTGDPIGAGHYDVLEPVQQTYAVGYDVYDVMSGVSDLESANHRSEDETVVTITPLGTPTRGLTPGSHDALFWTESSIEKFFFPYYVRHLDKKQFDVLYNVYMGLRPDGTPNSNEPVIAMSHLPTSDYDDETLLAFHSDVRARLGLLSTVGVIVGSAPVQSLPAYLLATIGTNALDSLLGPESDR